MKRLSLCIIMAAMLLLTGCLKATSVEQYGFVVLMGVDRGEAKKYMITFMLQQEEDSSDSQAGSGGAQYLSVEAEDIFEAIRTLIPAVPYDLNLSRANLIVFSEEMAMAGEMQEFLDFSWSALRLRQSCKLVVAMGEAKEFMKGLESDSKPNITKLQYSLMQNYTAEGVTTASNYALFNQGIVSRCFDSPVTLGRMDKSAPEDAIPQEQDYSTMGVERKGGMESYTAGCALFDGWRMRGVLNEKETLILLLATGKLEYGHIGVDNGGDALVIGLKEAGAPRIEFDLSDAPHAKLSVTVKCEIQRDMSGRAKAEWESKVRELVENYIEAELLRVFKICVSLDSDAMGFGRYASARFTDTKEWEACDWKALYRNMTAEFSVNAVMNDEELETYRE